jgi:hypothetical protein
MKTNCLRFAALAAAFALCACGRPGDAGTESAAAPQATGVDNLPQSFELKVDGRPMTLSPDQPKVSQVTAGTLNGGTVLWITAMDRGHDVAFAIHVASDDGVIGPGSYPAYTCGRNVLDCSDRNRLAALTPYPTGKPPAPQQTPVAWLNPELGLKPATLTIEWIKDVYWLGVGPAKRIKGHFEGTLAHVEGDRNNKDHVVPPTHGVEGTFELYASMH